MADLQELKSQFGLLNKKLEQQRIVTDELLQSSMKAKTNAVERWYKQRMLLSGVAAPVVAVVFLARNYDMGVASWGFGLLVLLIGLLELIFALTEYEVDDRGGRTGVPSPQIGCSSPIHFGCSARDRCGVDGVIRIAFYAECANHRAYLRADCRLFDLGRHAAQISFPTNR